MIITTKHFLEQKKKLLIAKNIFLYMIIGIWYYLLQHPISEIYIFVLSCILFQRGPECRCPLYTRPWANSLTPTTSVTTTSSTKMKVTGWKSIKSFTPPWTWIDFERKLTEEKTGEWPDYELRIPNRKKMSFLTVVENG